MKFQVTKGILLWNGAQYAKGSVFDAEKSEVDKLIEQGFVAPVLIEQETKESDGETSSTSPTKNPNGTQDDDDMVEAPTVEEFAELKAEKQNAILIEIGFEPASNKEERIAQYRAWYESDQEDDNGEGDCHLGGEQ